MGVLFRLLELLLLAAPVIGVIYAGIRTFASLQRQREAASDPAEVAPAGSPELGNPASNWRAIRRAIDAHDQTNARWLEYELDAAKLLDFPAMTDMRDPLTTAFHKAKLAADFHRPVRAEDLLDDREGARLYLDAVESYVTAFNAAEAEATRKGRSDFSREERQRLARAQSLLRVAADNSATQQERQRAYGLARSELDGLIVFPGNTRASIERAIAGELDG
ncbi:hypothetical protein [Mycobacterium szulgai]|uniref:hypothetical protein n=1 Tax=Mycobacterium szulgai TaxID=1787 RepID=UPI0021F29135|nr:hypothetical protein [Mycobacterium szulgai]MCV7076255.1 hypothetical protein [Mycobacterium szulgai]